MLREADPDVAERAKKIYNERLKSQLEASSPDQFFAIEPDSGEFFVGATLGCQKFGLVAVFVCAGIARIFGREFKSRELNRGQESFQKQEITAPPPSDEEKSPDPVLTDWALGMSVYSQRVKRGSGLFLATLSLVPTAHVSKKDSRPRFYSTLR
ncbi:MAG: hypothetical protein WDZ51_15205 [Pirellulaceae bacterium]